MSILMWALVGVGDAHAAEEPEVSLEERIARSLELPVVAQSLRDKGVEPEQVEQALGAAKGKGMSAKETAESLQETEKAVDEHGPVDNFGAFVQGLLDQGLRGRDLAAAIRAEHVARGHGPREGKGPRAKMREAERRGKAGARRGQGDRRGKGNGEDRRGQKGKRPQGGGGR